MEVSGYVVRYCTEPDCRHVDDGRCTNPVSSKYYIDPKDGGQLRKILGTKLVVAHDDRHVIGQCVLEDRRSNEGIYIKCLIDDVYLIECMQRRFADYVEKYNPRFPNLETFWKKVLSSFSLSHCLQTGEVTHVSLVDTPGRIGTSVVYTPVTDIRDVVLVRRPENLHISDIVSSHSTYAAYAPDRQDYLIRNTVHSKAPTDLVYLTASRDYSKKMPRSVRHGSSLYRKFEDAMVRQFVDRAIRDRMQQESERGSKRRREPVEEDHDGSSSEDDMYDDVYDDTPTQSHRRSKRPRKNGERVEANRQQEPQSNGATNALLTKLVETHKAMMQQLQSVQQLQQPQTIPQAPPQQQLQQPQAIPQAPPQQQLAPMVIPTPQQQGAIPTPQTLPQQPQQQQPMAPPPPPQQEIPPHLAPEPMMLPTMEDLPPTSTVQASRGRANLNIEIDPETLSKIVAAIRG